MTTLRQRMIEDMKVRNLSPPTPKTYLERVVQFAKHFGKLTELLDPQEIRAYQIYLINQKKTPWYILDQNVYGLRFLYRITFGKK